MDAPRDAASGDDSLTSSSPSDRRIVVAPTAVLGRWSIGFAVFWILALVALELLVRVGMATGLFLPAPSVVGLALSQMLGSGALVRHLTFTFARIAGGLFFGATLGVTLGLAAGGSRRLRRLVDPLVAALHPIPRLAFFPLLIVMFGIGESSKIAAVALGSFFPMFLNTVAGVRGMNPVHLEIARNCGADRRQMFLYVLLPGAMPLMLTGLRLAANTAFHGTIGVEMVGSRTGLGAMLWLSWQTFRIDQLYAILVVVAAIGIGLASLIRWVTSRSAPWLVEKRGSH